MLSKLQEIFTDLGMTPNEADDDLFTALERVKLGIENLIAAKYAAGREQGHIDKRLERGDSRTVWSNETVSTNIQQIEEAGDDVRYIWDVWLEVGSNRTFHVVASCPEIEDGQSVRLLRVDYDGVWRHAIDHIMVDHYDTMPWGVDRDRDTLALDE